MSFLKNRLRQQLKSKPCTLLAVGPMSINCINAAIEIANQTNKLLMMIASRRQIDSVEMGGGYVNNWDTKSYAKYVFKNDKSANIILARDHGGPWQNDKEVKMQLSLRDALESAKNSFKCDIDSGFQILHLDPSMDPYKTPNVDEVLERVFELYEFCYSYAQANKKEVLFEIGTEEQSGETNKLIELEYVLNRLKIFTRKNSLPFPNFCCSSNWDKSY